jgi:enoyl-CoA hydratase
MDEAQTGVICGEEGRAGLIRLARPRALNALTLDMIRKLEAFTHACADNSHISGVLIEAEGKAFCAGGDIRSIRDWVMTGAAEADRYYREEYQHNWSLQCFPKPHVALIDGIVMGGGVGVCLFGAYRVAGENIRFAMPETGIGFVPDIGGSWFLPRMPGRLGLYLGLVGQVCGPADAYYIGVVTHCIASRHFNAIKAAMIAGEPMGTVLDGLHEHPGPSELEKMRDPIDRIFAAPSLDGILKNLECEGGEHRDWARRTLEILAKRSPLSLKVTFEFLRRGEAHRTLKEALVVEYRLATRLIRRHDFLEGVRAAIIDKDQSPKWEHASLAEVDDALVQSLFEPLPEGDLQLQDYWTSPRPSH